MKLNGRKLSTGDAGEDVAWLHRDLQQLGFSIDAAEVTRKFFGQTTSTADRKAHV